MSHEKLKTLHLFAGAGGGLLADLILGHEPVCAVEWDAYCCQVLRERAAEGWFPGLQVFEGDVRMFDPSEYAGRISLVHAGVPCQPWSVAGKRKGKDDERNLWPDTLRIIGEVGPHYVFLENVPGIVSWNGGEYLAWIVGRLAGLGYDCRWTLLGADQVGAPHRRERWWLLAHAAGREVNKRERGDLDKTAGRGEGIDTAALPGSEDVAHSDGARLEEYRMEHASLFGGPSEAGAGHERKEKIGDVADASGGTRQREAQGQAGHAPRRGQDISDSDGAGRTEPPRGQFGSVSATDGEPAGRESGGNSPEGEQRDWGDATRQVGGVVDGLAADVVRRSWWEEEPDIGRVSKGEENRVAKLKALGNGQVPLQAAFAFTILMGEAS